MARNAGRKNVTLLPSPAGVQWVDAHAEKHRGPDGRSDGDQFRRLPAELYGRQE
jgi:hypothetical protein